MNEQYREIFGDIWDRMSFLPAYFRVYNGEIESRAMRISINAVERALRDFDGRRVRDDARIFLVSSIYSVVVLPQMMQAERSDALPEGIEGFERGLQSSVERDVVRVLLSAQERTHEDGEVSSAAVVRGLERVLDDLRLKAAGIWARKEG